jgi:hypothetical protein
MWIDGKIYSPTTLYLIEKGNAIAEPSGQSQNYPEQTRVYIHLHNR